MKIKKKIIAILITVAMLLSQIPISFAADTAPAEQFSLTPGGTYYFDLSAQSIPGTMNADALKWVPFTYVGTVNAYSLTGLSSGVSSSSNSATASDRSLFVAEYNISVGKSWDNFDAAGLIFGKGYNSGGISYTIRSLSAGNTWNSSNLGVPASNEWDQILNKNSAFIKNWNKMSWGQDTATRGSKYRAVRGIQFAGFWSLQVESALDPECGLRPALQIQNPTALGKDGLKTVTFDMDGNGTLVDKSLTSATVVYTGKLTLPALTNANGFNYTGAGKSGWNIGTTFYEPGTSVDLPSGTVLKAGCKYDSEQLNLPIGTYYFDLSAQIIPGTKNSALPDSSLKWVPFTYAGTVNAYSRIGAGASTDQTVSVNKRSLFVADYNVTKAVSWDELNNNGLIFGKAYSKGSVNYLLRSPSAGSNITGSGNSLRGLPLTNEWDQILDKDMDFIKNTSEMYSWGQDTNLLVVGERYLRGYQSLPNGVWSCSASAMPDTCGFRPTLEVLQVDALGTDSLKTVTFNMGSQGTIGDKKTITSATVVYTGELTLPAITEANGFYYTGIGTGTLGWYAGSTFYVSGAKVSNLTKGSTLTPGYGTAPNITGPTTLTLTQGYSATSTGAYTITGSAPVTVTKTSGDDKITWNNATKKLDIAAGLAAGSYPVTLSAINGAVPDAILNFTLTVNPTYTATVTPNSYTFDATIEGYGEQAAQNFIIWSTGTGTITGLNASLTDVSKFEISEPLTSETILPGGTAAVKVRPKTGLPVGTHTANLKIMGNNGLSVTIGLSFKVNALVNAKTPVINLNLTDKTTNVGTPVTLDATATVNDGGSPTYEWYSNTTRSTLGATKLGVTTSTYSPEVSSTGTTYYYCVVTNTNNSVNGSKTATITSTIAEVRVNTVPVAPTITGPTEMTLTEGYNVTSTGEYTITGTSPATVIKTSGDAGITWNDTTKKLDIAAGLGVGSYPVLLTVSNGILPDATLNFTLTVNDSVNAAIPVITLNLTDKTTNVGTPVTLDATATVNDGGSPSYEWYSNTTRLTSGATKLGVTTSTYSPDVSSTGTTYYYCMVTNTNNSATGTKTATITSTIAEVTVSTAPPPAPAVTGVTVAPDTITVQKGNTQSFSASVTGTNNPAKTVVWSVSGNTSVGTTIDTSGLLAVAVDETANTLTVTAVSTVDNSKSGTAAVTVSTAPPPAPAVTGVTVAPDTITVQKGNTQSFSASVTGTNNPAKTVVWSVSGNTSVGTTIDTSGLLAVAVDETANTLTVTAVSTVDNSKSGTAAVTVSTAPPPAPPPVPAVTPVIPPVPLYNADVTGTNTSKTNLPVTVDSNAGSAAVDMGSIRQNDIFANGGTTVITVPSISGVDTYTLGIPVAYLSIPDVKGTLTFSTAAGSMILPANMLAGVEGSEGKKAEISISQADANNLPDDVKAEIGDRPVIELAVTLDGKRTVWNNPKAPVKLSIPYTPTASELLNPEAIVIWYIDGSGNVVSVPNGHYDRASGTVSFIATHFSQYAVGYNKVSFNDVLDTAWYSKAIGFIAARGITSGSGNGQFGPMQKLTRGQFIVMVMKAYGINPDQNPAENFADSGNTYYTNYLAAAKRLGISDGVGNNRFAPDNEITRQEMFVLLYNALKAIGNIPKVTGTKTLADFSDGGQVASWARDAMTFFVQAGKISGTDGRLSPKSTTSRAEMAQVLYNLLSK